MALVSFLSVFIELEWTYEGLPFGTSVIITIYMSLTLLGTWSIRPLARLLKVL